MKWHAYGEDDHLGDGVHAELQQLRGWVPRRPGRPRAPNFGLGIGQGRLAQQCVLHEAERRTLALLRLHDRHRTPAGESEITPYVDGQAVSYTKSAEGTGAGTSPTRRCTGCRGTRAELFGAGSMQDLALYDTTLSADTIARTLRARRGRPESHRSPRRRRLRPRVCRCTSTPRHPPRRPGRSPTTRGTSTAAKATRPTAAPTATISHTFSSPGTYTVDLQVKDSLGEKATVSHTITVSAALGQYEQAVEDTSGIAHFWPMGESSGSTFADALDGAERRRSRAA